MDLWTIILVKRHTPETIVLNFPCFVQTLPELIRGLSKREYRSSVSDINLTHREYTREHFSKSDAHGTMTCQPNYYINNTRATYPVKVATSINVWGLYSVAV